MNKTPAASDALRSTSCLTVLLVVLACVGPGLRSRGGDGASGGDSVRLLKYPFPYEAAVTINSDIDGATVEKFNAVHALVNETNPIPLRSEAMELLLSEGVKKGLNAQSGEIVGFGLPLADSFWLYESGIGVYERFDYTRGLPVPQTHDGKDLREIVDEWFQKGWLDTLHTTGSGDMRREATQAGLAWMAERPERLVKVWVNHSSTVTPAAVGPCVRSSLELLPKNLFKCLTGSLCLVGAEGLARRIAADPYPARFPPGQGLRCWALSVLLAASLLSVLAVVTVGRLRRRPALLAGSAGLLLGTVLLLQLVPVRYHLGDDADTPYYCADLLRQRGFAYYWLLADVPGCRALVQDSLCLPETEVSGQPTILHVGKLDDGASVLIFPRCYKGVYGVRSLELLTAPNLSELCRRQATAILFTHWTSKPQDVFTADGLQGLRNLDRFYREGKVWVAPTSRILDFTFARTFLRFTVEVRGDKRLIRVSGIASPLGELVPPTLANLQGVTFDCPSGRPVALELAGTEIAAAELEVRARGDRTLLQVPWRRSGASAARSLSGSPQAGQVSTRLR
jgi:hypothetical protein